MQAKIVSVGLVASPEPEYLLEGFKKIYYFFYQTDPDSARAWFRIRI